MKETQDRTEGLMDEFCDEANELLQDLPDKLHAFANDSDDAEAINKVFRSVHTIKGTAGFFGLPSIKTFAHSLEDTLDEIRHGAVIMQEELARCLVEGFDMLGEMVTCLQNGEPEPSLDDAHHELLARIQSLCASSSTGAEHALLDELRSLAREMAKATSCSNDEWAQRILGLIDQAENKVDEPQEEAESQQPLEPSSLIEETFVCGDSDLTQSVHNLLRVFMAVDDGSYVKSNGEDFLNESKALAEWAEQQSQPELVKHLNEVIDAFAMIFNSPMDMDSYLIAAVWDRFRPVVEILRPAIATQMPSSEALEQGGEDKPAQQKSDAKSSGDNAKSRLLRVREETVDRFLEDVSNLFITCERLKDIQARIAGQLKTHVLVDELRQINGALAKQSTELQRSVVALRKVPVRGLFSKFPRVARSLASKLGKQLNVHLHGEEIEIDKSLVEDLDGPVMHMVRNVCDHGIETPDEREQRGAPATGNLWLECAVTKSHVIITIRDDGRGIDPERLRRKAVEKEIMSAEQAAELSVQEAVELIFHPGFSTAEQISDISGRGVGLDVVRTRLREHNGGVHVTSELGKGTTFRLEIPIRKAVVVVDGLLVRQGDSKFVIPFEHIREIVRISNGEMSAVQGQKVGKVRGEPYGAASLAELLDIRDASKQMQEVSECVLVKAKEQSLLLTVEAVIGQRKVVVTDLSTILPCCEKICGVAQLGGGDLALVLSIPELIGCS